MHIYNLLFWLFATHTETYRALLCVTSIAHFYAWRSKIYYRASCIACNLSLLASLKKMHHILIYIWLMVWCPPWGRLPACQNQCCGSMTFWYGSGSADPCLWPIWIRILLFTSLTFKTQKNNKKKKFSAYYFMKVPRLHHFSKIKSQKEVTKQYKSGPVPLTYGSDGSGFGSATLVKT